MLSSPHTFTMYPDTSAAGLLLNASDISTFGLRREGARFRHLRDWDIAQRQIYSRYELKVDETVD
jgi:hypothetical protein